MALDGLAGAFYAAGFDDVGIERALDEPIHSAGFPGDTGGFVVEDGNELGANALALGFGIGDAGQLPQEPLTGVDSDNVQSQLVTQVLLHALKLVLAENTVIDEDA